MNSRRDIPSKRPSRHLALAGVGVGLAVCAIVAVVAVLAPPRNPPPAPGIVPSLWLSDLAPPQARGFAAPGYSDPAMRVIPAVAPPPTIERAEPPAPVIGTQAPPAPPAAPPVATAALTETVTEPVVAPPVPRAQPVTRSRVPQPRPALPVPALADAAPADGDSATVVARSIIPAARPDAVARLATTVLASLSTPVEDAAPPLTRTQPSAIAPSIALGTNPCGRARDIPRRAGSAADGATVMASLRSVSGRARDDALVQQVLEGNVPGHLRTLVPVTFDATTSGRPTRVTLCVMPDYLSVGSDDNNVRIPLGLPAALRVASNLNMALPTRRIVDAIYAQADIRLAPSPMVPTNQMASTAYFIEHNATIESQRRRSGAQAGVLIAGHKKDVVISARLAQAPGRVAIYGWHRTNGRAIQPLSTVHGAQYADYSHGIRLISRTAYVNGRAVDLATLLGDGELAGLISDEGPIRNSRLLAQL